MKTLVSLGNGTMANLCLDFFLALFLKKEILTNKSKHIKIEIKKVLSEKNVQLYYILITKRFIYLSQ